jgi:hypothetical protein
LGHNPPSEKHAEVFVEEDVGVEDDRAPRDLPRAVHLPQRILAATGEVRMIRLQVRAVDQKRGPRLDFAVFQRRRLAIADQVAGARRGILGPGDPGEGRYLWRKWVPACAGMVGRGPHGNSRKFAIRALASNATGSSPDFSKGAAFRDAEALGGAVSG